MMQAAMIYAPGDVRYETVPKPRIEADEILLTVETALSCGTDLKTYRRGHPILIPQYPSAFGHECAGVVAEVGAHVDRFKVGDRIVVANSAPCDACFYCLKKQPELCDSLSLLNGAYAQFLKIPARITAKNTLLLPQDLSTAQAAFCEPLSVCIKGIESTPISKGTTVCVLGLGAIGQMMIRLAKLQGAHVTALGRSALKRNLASTFGQADQVDELHAYESPLALKKALCPEGWDIVIEAIGLPETWEMALNLVRRGGMVNWFGGCPSGSQVSLDTARMHYDQITIVSPFHHTPRHFRQALDLLSTGHFDPTPLITMNLPMSDLVQGLEAVSSGHALKVAFSHPQTAL
jgi:L-iditol 2-dehydrogenase